MIPSLIEERFKYGWRLSRGKARRRAESDFSECALCGGGMNYSLIRRFFVASAMQ